MIVLSSPLIGLLKNPFSGVLTLESPSTYLLVRLRRFGRCGLAERLFEQPLNRLLNTIPNCVLTSAKILNVPHREGASPMGKGPIRLRDGWANNLGRAV